MIHPSNVGVFVNAVPQERRERRSNRKKWGGQRGKQTKVAFLRDRDQEELRQRPMKMSDKPAREKIGLTISLSSRVTYNRWTCNFRNRLENDVGGNKRIVNRPHEAELSHLGDGDKDWKRVVGHENIEDSRGRNRTRRTRQFLGQHPPCRDTPRGSSCCTARRQDRPSVTSMSKGRGERN